MIFRWYLNYFWSYFLGPFFQVPIFSNLDRYEGIDFICILNDEPFIWSYLSAMDPCPRIIFKMKFRIYEKSTFCLAVFYLLSSGFINSVFINGFGVIRQIMFPDKLYVMKIWYHCVYRFACTFLSLKYFPHIDVDDRWRYTYVSIYVTNEAFWSNLYN